MRVAPIIPALLLLAAACGGADSPAAPAQNDGSIAVVYSGSANGSLSFHASTSTDNDMAVASRIPNTTSWTLVGIKTEQAGINQFTLGMNGAGPGTYSFQATCGSNATANCLASGALMLHMGTDALTTYAITGGSVTIAAYGTNRVTGSFTVQAAGESASQTITISGQFDVPLVNTGVTIPGA